MLISRETPAGPGRAVSSAAEPTVSTRADTTPPWSVENCGGEGKVGGEGGGEESM